MLSQMLTGLASAGGTALVSAMVTDGWEEIKTGAARLLGRGEARAVAMAGQRLEESRTLVAGQVGGKLEQAQQEQALIWRARLGDLLEEHPEVASGLKELIGQAQSVAGVSAGPVVQKFAAYDQARQAVQGHGVQNVNFGDHSEPSTRSS